MGKGLIVSFTLDIMESEMYDLMNVPVRLAPLDVPYPCGSPGNEPSDMPPEALAEYMCIPTTSGATMND
jgi:hypothetical protein